MNPMDKSLGSQGSETTEQSKSHRNQIVKESQFSSESVNQENSPSLTHTAETIKLSIQEIFRIRPTITPRGELSILLTFNEPTLIPLYSNVDYSEEFCDFSQAFEQLCKELKNEHLPMQFTLKAILPPNDLPLTLRHFALKITSLDNQNEPGPDIKEKIGEQITKLHQLAGPMADKAKEELLTRQHSPSLINSIITAMAK